MKKYTRYELARLLGARALQLSTGVIPQIKTKEIDPLKQAELEFKKNKIPFDVVR
ncbi:MAG: DNA-directed RNA polymerase subunit K [Candidatus Aenigmarchaeota archaeon ex4484_52]|nr:MAG: DNA-directed RNA polymerase subunit K [Candidatus Aenigmarchaeota archaeon ex4484_52]